jgi:hypothetical protein
LVIGGNKYARRSGATSSIGTTNNLFHFAALQAAKTFFAKFQHVYDSLCHAIALHSGYIEDSLWQ